MGVGGPLQGEGLSDDPPDLSRTGDEVEDLDWHHYFGTAELCRLDYLHMSSNWSQFDSIN